MPYRILVIDDDPNWIEFSSSDITRFVVIAKRSLEEVIACLENDRFELVIASSQCRPMLETIKERSSDEWVVRAGAKPTLEAATQILKHRIDKTLGNIIPSATRLRKRVDLSDSAVAGILDDIERHARDSAKLIDRVLGPLCGIEPQWVEINAVIFEVMEDFEAKESAITFERNLSSDLPRVHLPPAQITEIASNLVENACKAMCGVGMVRASTRIKDLKIQFRVEDTGPGIPLEIQQFLFNRPVPSNGPQLGSGLGLWLSRLFLQRLDGSIGIEKSDSNGTTILVELPVKNLSDNVG